MLAQQGLGTSTVPPRYTDDQPYVASASTHPMQLHSDWNHTNNNGLQANTLSFFTFRILSQGIHTETVLSWDRQGIPFVLTRDRTFPHTS